MTWEFFQSKFKKKYVSQRYLDKKRKEFLELKQGRMTVTEDERKFVQLSKYAQECIPTEANMCTNFEERFNEDIKWLVRILELREFMILVYYASKAEELNM